MLRKRLMAAAVAATFSLPSSASVQTQMQGWFNEMGAYGNVSGPQVVSGQTGTSYTGGSMYARTPVRNYSLANVAPPSVRAGCGGIDLFAGSFSFINAEQFTALLRNVANNAIGHAFMLAVDAVSPELGNLLKYLQDQAAKLNGMNLNSCQMAEGLVTAVGSAISDKKEQSSAQGTGSTLSNLWSDSFESYDKWRASNSAKKSARDAAASKDSNLAEILKPGNVVWKALQKTSVPDDLRELMMSMVGTIIIKPPGDSTNTSGSQTKWEYVKGTGIKFTDFIGKVEASATNDLSLLKCGADYDCMNPGITGGQSVASLAWHVAQTMGKAKIRIENRQSQSFSGIDYAVYMNTGIPVWRITGVAAHQNNDLLPQNYSEIIATELAYNWFSEMIGTLQKALANGSMSPAPDVAEAVMKLNDSINVTRQLAATEYMASYKRIDSMLRVQRSVKALHEQMLSSLPADVQSSLLLFRR